MNLREFLRVTELLLAVQEISLVYSKHKTLLHGQYSELKFIITVYRATPRAEVLYALLRPLPEPKCRLGEALGIKLSL
jgi:hypothetical protein